MRSRNLFSAFLVFLSLSLGAGSVHAGTTTNSTFGYPKIVGVLDCGVIGKTRYRYQLVQIASPAVDMWTISYALKTQPVDGGDVHTFNLVSSGHYAWGYAEYRTQEGRATASLNQDFKRASLLLGGAKVALCLPVRN